MRRHQAPTIESIGQAVNTRFKDSVIKDPKDAVHYPTALAHALVTRYPEEALRVAEQALEISPKHSEALEAKGDALSKLGRYKEAMKVYTYLQDINGATPHSVISKRVKTKIKGIELLVPGAKNFEKDTAWDYIYKGRAWLTDHPADALGVFEKARKRWPENINVLLGLGDALSACSRHDEAFECYWEAALLVMPDEHNIFNDIIKIRIERIAPLLSDAEKKVFIDDALKRLRPENAQYPAAKSSHVSMAIGLHEVFNIPDVAYEHFVDAIKYDPDNVTAYLLLIDRQLGFDEYDEMWVTYEKLYLAAERTGNSVQMQKAVQFVYDCAVKFEDELEYNHARKAYTALYNMAAHKDRKFWDIAQYALDRLSFREISQHPEHPGVYL